MSGWIDPIDMKVRRILADAFERAYRPHLTVDAKPCLTCRGDGTVDIIITTMPLKKSTQKCLACNGTGLRDYQPECERCHGNGEIGIAGMSINPNSGVLARDPQNDDIVICPDCLGSGIDE